MLPHTKYHKPTSDSLAPLPHKTTPRLMLVLEPTCSVPHRFGYLHLLPRQDGGRIWHGPQSLRLQRRNHKASFIKQDIAESDT